MEKKNHSIITNHKIILILIIFFIFNAFKFINQEGSDHPLISTLFNMIIFLSILVFFFHGKEIDGNSLYPKEVKVQQTSG